jgi:polyisoprenoid-binding protein YceI
MLRRSLLTLCAAFALALAASPAARAEPFVLDKGYTALVFSWSHLGLSRQQARFNAIDGVIDLDTQNPENSKIDITIRTTSVQSGIDTFDRILRSPDYFDATTYPAITFRSTSVRRTGEVTADVTGDLEIRGKSVPIVLAVTLNQFGDHPSGTANPSYAGKKVAAFSAKAGVARSAWGMGRGAPLVSDEIEIAIETELISKD